MYIISINVTYCLRRFYHFFQNFMLFKILNQLRVNNNEMRNNLQFSIIFVVKKNNI